MFGKKHPTEKLGRNPQLEDSNNPAETPVESIKESRSFMSTIASAPKNTVRKFKGLHKNLQLAIILLFTLVIIGGITIALSTNNVQEVANEEETTIIEETPQISAEIKLQEGTLQTKDEEGEWVDYSEDVELAQETALRTVGATSRSVVRFEDGSELRLDANSEIEIVTMTENRIVINHINGYTYSRVSDVRDRKYIVETIDAKYEAVGTAFRTTSSGDKQAVEVFHKSVLETSTNTTLQEGEKLIVKSFVNPRDDETVSRLDIEEIKQDPFIIWNRNLELGDDEYKDKLGFLQDFEAPDITISSPENNETILLEPSDTEGRVEISGTTERGAIVTVQSKSQPGSQPVNVTVGNDGNFKTPVLTAPLGNSVFTFVVKDRVGNTQEVSVRYNFQRKSQPIATTGSIALTVELKDDQVVVTWALGGSLVATDGIRVVYGTKNNPSYKSSNTASVYVATGNTTSLELNNFDSDKTYNFRVCIYDDEEDTCSNYSNQRSLDIPDY